MQLNITLLIMIGLILGFGCASLTAIKDRDQAAEQVAIADASYQEALAERQSLIEADAGFQALRTIERTLKIRENHYKDTLRILEDKTTVVNESQVNSVSEIANIAFTILASAIGLGSFAGLAQLGTKKDLPS